MTRALSEHIVESAEPIFHARIADVLGRPSRSLPMVHAAPLRRYRLRLINPRSPLSTITMPNVIRKMTLGRKGLFAPTGLMICAAAAPSHWDVELIDECVTDAPHRPAPGCDVVGISAMTTQAKRAYEIADAYRRLGVTVVMGGIHPSAMPEDALAHCDAVCKGDAESTLPHLLADWERARENGGSADGGGGNGEAAGDNESSARSAPQTGEHLPTAGSARRTLRLPKRIYDWAEYPTAPIATPRKDVIDPRQYLVANPIQTTRGCPHACTFCTTPGVFGRKFRQRSISDIVEEMRAAKAKYGTWCFIFADDDFAGNHAWALELCAAIEPLKVAWASQCDILISRNDKLLAAMRRSGCVGLILGLESRRQGTLSEAGKRYVQADSYEWRIRKIQSHGISLWGAFIFGFDHDDWRDLMWTTRWAQRMNLAMSCYPILTPYPGTGIWQEYEKSGRIRTRDWDKYNGVSVVFEPRRMSPAQLRHAQMAAFAEFFSCRSAVSRLKFWPLKKRAWVANLACAYGLQYYYKKKGQPLPSFRDFLDPSGRAWAHYEEARAVARETEIEADADGHADSDPEDAQLAAALISQAEPYLVAGATLAASAAPQRELRM